VLTDFGSAVTGDVTLADLVMSENISRIPAEAGLLLSALLALLVTSFFLMMV